MCLSWRAPRAAVKGAKQTRAHLEPSRCTQLPQEGCVGPGRHGVHWADMACLLHAAVAASPVNKSSFVSVAWLFAVSFCICLPCVINTQMFFFFSFSLFVEIIEPTTSSPVSSPGQYPHTSTEYVWVLFLQEPGLMHCHINKRIDNGQFCCGSAGLSPFCLCASTDLSFLQTSVFCSVLMFPLLRNLFLLASLLFSPIPSLPQGCAVDVHRAMQPCVLLLWCSRCDNLAVLSVIVHVCLRLVCFLLYRRWMAHRMALGHCSEALSRYRVPEGVPSELQILPLCLANSKRFSLCMGAPCVLRASISPGSTWAVLVSPAQGIRQGLPKAP